MDRALLTEQLPAVLWPYQSKNLFSHGVRIEVFFRTSIWNQLRDFLAMDDCLAVVRDNSFLFRLFYYHYCWIDSIETRRLRYELKPSSWLFCVCSNRVRHASAASKVLGLASCRELVFTLEWSHGSLLPNTRINRTQVSHASKETKVSRGKTLAQER